MTPDSTTSHLSGALCHRGIRIVTVSDGKATAEDLTLDHTEATCRFGPNVAALIFDDQRPGALDLTRRTATLRYGAPAAALIFPAGTASQAPAIDDDGVDPRLALPLGDRDVS